MGANPSVSIAQSLHILGGAPATYSKHPGRYAPGVTPVVASHAAGPYIWDDTECRYIDLVAALGAIVLGYKNPRVAQAIINHGEGSLSLPSPLETAVAEQLCEAFPGAECVRFGVNGSDVTQAAVRIVRAATGKPDIVLYGYSGFCDHSIVHSGKNGGILPGVADYVHPVAWGDTAGLDALLKRRPVAAILFEIPPWENDDQAAWLTHLAALRDSGAVDYLVLDEIVTFPRYGRHGAQGLYGVTPDLTCVSKGLANGFPLSALVGKRALVEHATTGTVFMSSTFAGNTIGLAAAQATLSVIADSEAWERLSRYGEALRTGLLDRLRALSMPATMLGNYARMVVRWHEVPDVPPGGLRTLWIAEMALRGVLTNGVAIFPMACWDEHIVGHILGAAEGALGVIADVLAGTRAFPAALGDFMQDVFAVRP